MKDRRIGVLGNVDSGKTTIISVLSNNILDNGRGLARKKILKHNHEQESGRTSWRDFQANFWMDVGWIQIFDLF